MNRPPRNPNTRLFQYKRVLISLLQGFGVFIAALSVYGIFLRFGQGETEARAVTFSALVVGDLALILANRSWTRTIWQTLGTLNRAVLTIVAGTVLTLALVLYVPALRSIFHFSTLHLPDILVAVFAGFAGILWFELFKVVAGHTRLMDAARSGLT